MGCSWLWLARPTLRWAEPSRRPHALHCGYSQRVYKAGERTKLALSSHPLKESGWQVTIRSNSETGVPESWRLVLRGRIHPRTKFLNSDSGSVSTEFRVFMWKVLGTTISSYSKTGVPESWRLVQQGLTHSSARVRVFVETSSTRTVNERHQECSRRDSFWLVESMHVRSLWDKVPGVRIATSGSVSTEFRVFLWKVLGIIKYRVRGLS